MEELWEQYCYGVDIGGTGIKIGLFNAAGDLLEKCEISTRKTGNGKDVLKDAADFIKNKNLEKGIKKEKILGIGVALPGPVKDDGYILEMANLGMGNFNIEDEMSNITGFKVKAGNDMLTLLHLVSNGRVTLMISVVWYW